MSFFDVKRYAHGSRVPEWGEPADLEKDPATVPDPATTPVPPDLRAEIEAHIAKYPDVNSASIPALRAIQRYYGWCSPEGVEQAACVMRVTPASLIAVATFYDMLETRNPSTHTIYVCTNISCSLLGGDEILAAMQAAAAKDTTINVRAFECLGACDIAPMASVDSEYVGPLKASDCEQVVDQLLAGQPILPNKQLRNRPAMPQEPVGNS